MDDKNVPGLVILEITNLLKRFSLSRQALANIRSRLAPSLEIQENTQYAYNSPEALDLSVGRQIVVCHAG